MITHLAFLLFFGKAHGLFAFLFGASFHIQQLNNVRKGIAHHRRMLVRMSWLFVLGIFHGLFYPGDILCLLAIFGIVLLPMARLSNRMLMGLAVLLALQPVLLFRSLSVPVDPSYGEQHMDLLLRSLRDDGILQLFRNNSTQNRLIEISLGFSSGRIFQLCAWMLMGIVVSRSGHFRPSVSSNGRIYALVTITSIVAYLMLHFQFTDPALADLAARWKEVLMVSIYISLALMLARSMHFFTRPTIIGKYSRMSLTNYIGQGLIGSVLFYGYGAGLYKLGATWSLLVGIAVLFIQLAFSVWWLKRRASGPLEKLWSDLVSWSDRRTRS